MEYSREALELAEHLDAINRRVEEFGPTPDSAARMAKIIADSEAACAALRRAEAEAEIDELNLGQSART
jgi:hypothetical protein